MIQKPTQLPPELARPVRNGIRAALNAACEGMAYEHSIAPVSTLAMLIEQATRAVAHYDRIACAEFLRALADEVQAGPGCGNIDAIDRRRAAFETLSYAVQTAAALRGQDGKGGAA